MRERLTIFVPLTVAIIFVLFYFTFLSVTETLMVMLGVPLSLVGGVFSAMLLTLLVIPALYVIWRWYTEVRHQQAGARIATMPELPSRLLE